MYFTFTSLSTVGFGDLHPRNDPERLMCAFILITGVAMFSYILSIFIQILAEFSLLLEELDDSDNLVKFLKIIQRFNGGRPLEADLNERICEYFEFRWRFDRNQAIDEEDEIAILT